MFSNVRSQSFQSCRFLLNTYPVFNAKHFPMKPPLRTVKFFPKVLRKAETLDKSNHRLVYKFPYIPLLGGYMKSKISIPLGAFSISPVLYYLDETHFSSFFILLSGCLYYVVGLQLSKLAANVVGKMYVNKEDEITEVIMSSVDESGRRIDRIHKLEDLINIDYPDKFSQSLGFIAIGVENTSIFYKINTRACKFVDESACDYVFGFSWKSNENEISKSECKEKMEDINKRLPEK